MLEITNKSEEQKDAEAEVESFRKDLPPLADECLTPGFDFNVANRCRAFIACRGFSAVLFGFGRHGAAPNVK